ncbi:MAG: DUF599 domain-containing protein [Rhodobacteraceae bacterium]|nr:DUF599 domain-containing protein [Paracoccaceae bacterium]
MTETGFAGGHAALRVHDMAPSTLMSLLSPADLAALTYLVAAWWITGRLIEHPPAGHPSVAILMNDYRRAWMREMVTRQPRIFDASIMDNLRTGTSFFASACLIAIGGGVALIGNVDRLASIAGAVTHEPRPELFWELKILAVIVFVTNGLLNFVWAHRLFAYCAIVMAAVPNDITDPAAQPRAAQASDISISAAKNFNRGLRAVYFALGTLGWLAGPMALVATTTVAMAAILRREFWSSSRNVLMRDTPK